MTLADTLEWFAAHKVFFLTAHILGTVLGLGGATIADLLFFRFLKDYRISTKEHDVLHVLKNIIMGALALLILSGAALFASDIPRYSTSGPFLAKMCIVGIIAINGIALHIVVAPHLLRLDLKKHASRYRNWRRLAFALGGISVCSWYSAFFIAMLKTVMPQSFAMLFGTYAVLLLCTLVGTQVLERLLTAKARE